jgi:Cu+-exporting ATPase
MSTALESENKATRTVAGMVTSERVTIPVTGMTCAACQSFLQRTLTNEAGVQDAAVNLMLHNATVSFDPRVTSTSSLVEAIRHTRYGASEPVLNASVLEEQERHDEEQLHEYKQLRLKAIVSLIAGTAAMVLSMPLMSMSSTGGMERMNDPLMSWNNARTRSCFAQRIALDLCGE